MKQKTTKARDKNATVFLGRLKQIGMQADYQCERIAKRYGMKKSAVKRLFRERMNPVASRTV
jgi:hypothetical protein